MWDIDTGSAFIRVLPADGTAAPPARSTRGRLAASAAAQESTEMVDRCLFGVVLVRINKWFWKDSGSERGDGRGLCVVAM